MNATVAIENIETMPLDELEAAGLRIAQTIQQRKSREKLELIETFREMSAARGMTLEEVVSDIIPDMSRPPQYRHPENKDMVWCGRGRRPAWMKDLIDAGTPIDDLRVK